MRAKPTTGIDALPSPEEDDHRTWPAMPEGAACQSDKIRACGGRIRRQGDSPPDRTCRPSDQTLHSSVELVAHQSAPYRKEPIADSLSSLSKHLDQEHW